MPDILKKWYGYFLTTAFSITHYTFLNRLAPWAFTPWALPPFCPSMKGYERPPTILMIPSVCLWNRVINMYKSSYTYLHILFWGSFKKKAGWFFSSAKALKRISRVAPGGTCSRSASILRNIAISWDRSIPGLRRDVGLVPDWYHVYT